MRFSGGGGGESGGGADLWVYAVSTQAASLVRYIPAFAATTAASAVETTAATRIKAQRAGTIKKMSARGAGPTGGTVTFTVRKNGAATALTQNMPAGTPEVERTVDVTFAAGDYIGVECTTGAGVSSIGGAVVVQLDVEYD